MRSGWHPPNAGAKNPSGYGFWEPESLNIGCLDPQNQEAAERQKPKLSANYRRQSC